MKFKTFFIWSLPWCGAGDPGVGPGRVGHQHLAQGWEGAEEVSRKLRKIVNHELQSPGRGPLQLRRVDGGDGGALARLVADPVQRVLGSISAVSSQTEKVWKYENLLSKKSENKEWSQAYFISAPI